MKKKKKHTEKGRQEKCKQESNGQALRRVWITWPEIRKLIWILLSFYTICTYYFNSHHGYINLAPQFHKMWH